MSLSRLDPAALALGAAALAALGALTSAAVGARRPEPGRLAAIFLAVAWVLAAVAAAGVAGTGQTAIGSLAWVAGGGWSVRLGLRVDALAAAGLLTVLTTGLAAQVGAAGRTPSLSSRPVLAAMATVTAGLCLAVAAATAAVSLAGWAVAAAAAGPLLAATSTSHRGAPVTAASHWLTGALLLAAAVLALACASSGRLPAAFEWLAGSAGLVAGRPPGGPDALGPAVGGEAVWLVGLVALAAAIQAGVVPFHPWLAAAAEAAPATAALLQGAAAATGAYTLGRLAGLLPLAPGLGETLAVAGLIASVVAAMAGLAVRRLRVGLACSASAQAGLTAGLAGLTGDGAAVAFQVVGGVGQAGLALAAGLALRGVTTGDDLSRMGGLRRHLPLAWRCFLASALAMTALPPFAGFWAGTALLAAARAAGPGQLGLAWVALALAAAVPLRLGMAVFAGPRRATALAAAAGRPAGRAVSGAAVGSAAVAVLSGLAVAALQGGDSASPAHLALAGDGAAAGAAAAAGVVAVALAWLRRRTREPAPGQSGMPSSRPWLERVCHLDEAAAGAARWLAAAARQIWTFVDSLAIDTLVAGGLSLTVRGLGWALAWTGSGDRRGSAWLTVLAVLAALAAVLAAGG